MSGAQWNSAIKAFLEKGDMSIWKKAFTSELPQVEIEDLGDTEIGIPKYKQPPYEQRADVLATDSGSWLLDQITDQVAFPQELPAIKPINPDTDKTLAVTTIVEAIKPGEIVRVNFPEKKRLGYDFIDYRNPGNPLLMLFGASIKCFRQLGNLPNVLYISKRLEPALERESMQFYGGYDGRFRFYHPKALAGIKNVPVFTESYLPEELRLVFEHDFPVDCVIAVVEK